MSLNKNKYITPLILVIFLFFLWGFAHSILDVLNKHFQEVLVISKARSGLVQAVVYGGYFIMALPAGYFIQKFGYKKGVVFGLLLYGTGALLFIPAEKIMSFNYFLFLLFLIGSGLTFLETSANPYVTILGEKDKGASRINLAQSFNGLGWIVGPLVGGLLIFNADGTSGSVALPYTIIGIVVFFVAAVFIKVKLPEIDEEDNDSLSPVNYMGLWQNKVFRFGVIALFFYVAAQTGINSFFINYVVESDADISSRTASVLLSFGGMGLFMTGRLLGSWILRYVKPEILLTISAVLAVVSMILVVSGLGIISLIALIACYFFESIMFPTIFAISIKGLGALTKKGSSILIMSIVGGAVSPVIMGFLGEKNMAVGFLVPLFCFLIIVSFGLFLNMQSNHQLKIKSPLL